MSTYVPIQAITLSATASTVEFTGIPQTFTDLVLVASIFADNTTNRGTRIRFNSDSGSNYSSTLLAGNGTSAESNRTSSATFIPMTWFGAMVNSTTSAATCIININNYSNTTTNKTALIRANRAEANVSALVGLWRNTNAINTITLSLESNSFGSNSTFTLYGVGSGSPKAFGGDEVRTDGTYWYHIFRSSGRFEPVESLTNVDYLVVAGGGAGGASVGFGCGGGGGAGGFRTSAGTSGGNSSAESKLSLVANTAYTVTVGAGGTGSTSTARGNSGSNSSIGSLVVSDGGGGGGVQGGTSTGGNGGSGGGAAFSSSAGGSPSTNQGFAGGSTSSNGRTAGGGGAGAAGTSTAATSTRANGGTGIASSITGTSVTYAGGGGGSVNDQDLPGFGGSGGGGQGSNRGVNNAQAGTANTGGGGGGAADLNPGTGGNGGSGIIVIRYGV